MPYALITGASQGIGKAMAECLARRKHDLLLVARSESLLQQASRELQEKYGIAAHYLPIDLSANDAALQVKKWLDVNSYPVDILINNAGYGLWGNFTELTLEEQSNMLQLNVQTLVQLTYLLLPSLQQHSKACLMNVGSMAGVQAVPTLSLYAGSKALVNIFTRGLAQELKRTSVSVTLLAPGGVKTGFVERSGMLHMKETADKLSMEPEAVAEAAIRGMLAGRREIVPGFTNRFSAFMVRLLPKSIIETIAGNLYRKKEAKA